MGPPYSKTPYSKKLDKFEKLCVCYQSICHCLIQTNSLILFSTLSFNSADVCDSNPCQNMGICTPSAPGEYDCTCTDGFTGDECESKY